MTLQVNVNGTWKDADSISVKVGDTWKAADSLSVKSGGQWQNAYSAISLPLVLPLIIDEWNSLYAAGGSTAFANATHQMSDIGQYDPTTIITFMPNPNLLTTTSPSWSESTPYLLLHWRPYFPNDMRHVYIPSVINDSRWSGQSTPLGGTRPSQFSSGGILITYRLSGGVLSGGTEIIPI